MSAKSCSSTNLSFDLLFKVFTLSLIFFILAGKALDISKDSQTFILLRLSTTAYSSSRFVSSFVFTLYLILYV